uniref:Uncharacterized protein n=1 Tax=Junco hyemalis TaxID=40217 RepID=A0A8C5INZ6_JUNHY
MTEVNLRLYISIFPRNCTETLVIVENFMQTTILMRTSHFSVGFGALFLFVWKLLQLFQALPYQNGLLENQHYN